MGTLSGRVDLRQPRPPDRRAHPWTLPEVATVLATLQPHTAAIFAATIASLCPQGLNVLEDAFTLSSSQGLHGMTSSLRAKASTALVLPHA